MLWPSWEPFSQSSLQSDCLYYLMLYSLIVYIIPNKNHFNTQSLPSYPFSHLLTIEQSLPHIIPKQSSKNIIKNNREGQISRITELQSLQNRRVIIHHLSRSSHIPHSDRTTRTQHTRNRISHNRRRRLVTQQQRIQNQLVRQRRKSKTAHQIWIVRRKIHHIAR